MLKDSKFSSHLLHLSQLQTVNHKTLDEYRERLTTFEVKKRKRRSVGTLFCFFFKRIRCGLENLIRFQQLNVLVVVGNVEETTRSNVSIVTLNSQRFCRAS